jgi:hypothetical protein
MEPLTQTTVVAIKDPSQVAVARRAATDCAQLLNMDEQRISAISVVAVELANNLLQHAVQGELYLRPVRSLSTLEIAAVDGYSTASTPGLGLGAVQRFSNQFAAFSIPGRTTTVAARMSAQQNQSDVSVVCTAIHGETLSGDSWAVSDDGRTVLVIDGLGHGLLAADAAKAGVAVFSKHQASTPQQILERMHAAMRSTRGAAAAIAQINTVTRTIDFAGIGNISRCLLAPGRSQYMVSHNGTLGHQMRRVQQFQYSYEPNDLLVMQSDGLVTQFKAAIPPGLLAQPPFLIAPFLFSEQVRGRDDATLLVYRLV